jgi:glycerol-3-phosphate cytidylyltransferase-like family protein
VLVVGLIPDEEIIKVKGPPVMDNEERCEHTPSPA